MFTSMCPCVHSAYTVHKTYGRAKDITDLQIGVRDSIPVRLSNFNPAIFAEPSLLHVVDQMKKRRLLRDWFEM